MFVLGVGTCSLLGVAISGLARTQRSASAVVTLPYLVLSFISGVYFVFSSLPAGLQHVAALFPLKWMCQGLRSVFLPDGFAAAEPAHSWELGQVALVLAAWLVGKLGAVPEDVPLAAPGLTVAASPAGQHAWQDGQRRWDVYSAIILAATLVIVAVVEPPRQAGPVGRAAGCDGAAGTPRRRAAMTGPDRPWRAAAYLAGLCALLLAAELSGAVVTFILLALCPQCFMSLPLVWAAVAATALNSTPLLAGLANGQHGSELAATAAVSACTAAFSVAFGSWIVRIIDQSAERASLIEQLESTRAELAAAHREAGMAGRAAAAARPRSTTPSPRASPAW